MLGYKNRMNVDFYVIKGVAEELLDYLGYYGRYSFVPNKEKVPQELHPGQSAVISVNNDIVGVIGKVNPAIESEDVYVLEINLDKLLAKKVGKMKYKEISKFPYVKKDLAIVIDKKYSSQEIAGEIKRAGGHILQKIEVFDVYNKGLDPNKVSIAYSLTFENSDRTLTDEEVNAAVDKIVEAVGKKFGAELRK
jgi:phenylalanyl-tRNA synthetase beta chain